MKMGSYWQAGSAFILQVESRPPTDLTDAYNQVSVAKNTATLIFTEFINDFTQSHVTLAWWVISCLKQKTKTTTRVPLKNRCAKPPIRSFMHMSDECFLCAQDINA